ncbi:MAG: pyridoxal phosphate-dependent aminotransferase [Candidatus Eremiobacteraeota bacterium]|nr:pyridoxal phosphate-dependent aminotransferase [Candidatus Eremiobacteraeota bacterium]MBV8499478.1 pyridoxal phosphate-dependent aminotransferase [Candidatus Eremiobacteraeota bacterium]
MNPRVLNISASLIREIASKKRASSIDLGLGEPTLRPRREHLEHALRHVSEHGLRYTPNAGDSALRDRIARHYSYPDREHSRNVCVTVGSQEAMYVVLKTLLDPSHDELLIVEPAFPSYAKMAALEGTAARSVAMSRDEDFAFDPERIAAAIGERTRAIVLCSPCNPTARVVSLAAAETLARALERREGDPIWIVHDEIYREQTFTESAGYFAQIYAHTIVTNSLSKSNALTGLRLGWILGPADFVAQAIKVHAWATSCADTFAQHVALDVFNTPGGLQEHAAWYRERRVELLAALRESGLRFVAPEGAFYVCVRLPDGTPSHRAAEELIERHDVVAIPGVAFGQCMEGWLRLSWVAPAERVREGILRIADYCRNRAQAIQTV